MTPERWLQVEELYLAARDPERRLQVLAEADPELRREVEALLAEETAAEEPTVTMVGVGAQLGHYIIEGPLGAGGMGQVFRGRDLRLGRPVAIKIVNKQYSERFEREARAISALNHPRICTLYDVGALASGPGYLVMELVEGETLSARLKKGALPIKSVLRYGAQIADALAEAHSKAITHRDLKPSNIMLSKNGIKVLDFGLAKRTLPDEGLTKSNVVVGTPAYMAPEQLEGKHTDERADLFSLGLILYEMATAKLPFPGASLASMLTRGSVIVPTPSRAVPGLPPDFDTLVTKLLAKDPGERPQSAVEVGEALDNMTMRPATRGYRRAAFAACCIALLGLFAWFGYQRLAPGPTIGAVVSALPLTAFPGIEYDPTFSPDGKQIAFTASDGKSANNIYTMPVASQTRRRLTEGQAWERWPTWSPDGSQIAYLKRDSPPRWSVCLVPSTGGASRTIGTIQLSDGQLRFPPLAWTPDSRSMIVTTQNEEHRGVLGRISLDDGSLQSLKVPILHGNGVWANLRPDLSSPSVSSDGRWLAYADGGQAMVHRLGSGYTPEGQPIVVPLKTSMWVNTGWFRNRMIFSYSEAISDAKLVEWDLSGKARTFWVGPPLLSGLAISKVEDRIRIVASQGTQLPQLVLQRLDPARKRAGGELIRWPRSPRTDAYPAYSPNGSRVAFATNRTGRVELWIASPTGEGQRQLAASAQGNSPQWSRDGRRVLFTEFPTTEVMLLDAESGIARRFPTHPNGEYPTWSADEKYFYIVRRPQQIVRVRLADGAVEPIARGIRAQETPDGKALIISRDDEGLFSRAVTASLAQNQDTLLVKGSPHALSVTVAGVFYFVTGGELLYYDFGTRTSHNVGLSILGESDDPFSISPDQRDLVYAPIAGELDLISLEFAAAK